MNAPHGLRIRLLLLPLLLPALTLGASAASGAGNGDARVLIHLLTSNYDFYCHSPRELPACPGVKTEGTLYPTIYNAFLLVVGGDATEGVGAVTCGIDYDSGPTDGVGLDIFSWSICASTFLLEGSPTWPAPGSSNRITWDTATSCQRYEPGGAGTGVVARAGYFYCAAYAPATLRIGYGQHAGHLGQVLVTGCSGAESVIDDIAAPRSPSPLGYVAFSAGGIDPGYNPCLGAVPTAATTWSRIKALGAR